MNNLSNNNLEILTKQVLSGDCIAFIGAGVSCPEYPDWDNLIDCLCEECRVRDRMHQLYIQSSKTELARLARICNRTAFDRTLKDLMKPKSYLLERYVLLSQLPFKNYLTTNYDLSLLKAIENNGENVECITHPSAFQVIDQRRRVYYLRGAIDGNTNSEIDIVLNNDEFELAYESTTLRSFLDQTFRFNNICFIGCSLEDEYLERILTLCKICKDDSRARGDAVSSRVFILIDDQSAIPSSVNSTGLEVVRYEKQNDKHDGLTKLLEDWVNSKSDSTKSIPKSDPDLYQSKSEVPINE